MPLAVTGLTDAEYQTLQRWLAAGAPVEYQPIQPSAIESRQIAEWEELLNRPGSTEALVGRWLYEHLFRRMSISPGASRGTSSSGCVRAPQAASRWTS